MRYNLLMLRRIFGIGGILAAAVAFIFREALAGVIGTFAEKVLNPSLLDGGQFMTFDLADIIIIILIFVSGVVLTWPWLARHLQTDVERKSLRTSSTNRSVFSDLSFRDEKRAMFFSNEFKPILVDCTFRLQRVGLSDCVFDDGFRIEPKNITICSYDELSNISAKMPVLTRARLINTPIYCEHVFLNEGLSNDLFRGQALKGVVELDKSLLESKGSRFGNLWPLSIARKAPP